MKKQALLFLSTLLLYPKPAAAEAKTESQPIKTPHFEAWNHRLPARVGERNGGICSIGDYAETRILKAIQGNFEPRCFSDSMSKITFQIVFTDTGIPEYSKIAASNATRADDFYCEQAIWEMILPNPPAGGLPPQVTCTFYGNSENSFGTLKELTESVPENCVALHLIPRGFPNSALLFPNGELSEKKNVVFIDKKNLNSSLLTEFRHDWFNFFAYHRPLSAEIIRAQAAALKQKYTGLLFRDELGTKAQLRTSSRADAAYNLVSGKESSLAD